MTKRLHHGLYEVHLPVTDLARSIELYTGRLDFEIGFLSADGQGALLLYARGGTRWMLGLFMVASVDHRREAESHISFRIDEKDLDEAVPWLIARGIEPVHPPTAPQQGRMEEPIVHGWMPAAAVFFRDPDGHLLEFIADLGDPPRSDFQYRPLSEWHSLQGAADR